MLMADAQPDDSNSVFEGFDEFDFIFTAEEILAETSDPSNSGSAGTPDGLSCNDPYQHDFFNSDLDKDKSFKPPDGILEAIPGAAQDSCDPSSYLGGHDYKAGLGSECLFENSANLGTYFNVEFDYVTKENKPVMGPQSHASEWLTLSSSDHNLLSKGPNGGSFDLEHGFDNEQLQSEIPYHFAPYEIANQEAIKIQECKNYNNMYDPNGNEMELQLIERAFSLQTESKPHFNHCRSPKVRLQNEGRDSLSRMLIDEPVSSIDVYNSAYRSNMLHMGAKEINILPSPSMVFPMGTDATFIDTVHAKLENGQDNVFPSAGNSVVGADGECDGDNLNHYLTGSVISSEEEYASCMEDEREDDMPNHQDGEESNLGTQEKNISFSAGPSRAADTSLSEISCVKLSSCQDMTLKSEASTQHFRSLMNKLPVSDTNVESVAVAPEQPAVCKLLMSSKRQKVCSKNGEIQLLESCKKNTPAVKDVPLRGSVPVDDDSDICILDDISDPRHLPIPLGIAKPYAPTQRIGCIDNSPYLGAGGMRFKAFDERLTFTIALQDLSQPKSESSPPDGQLAVPLLRHQRIALSWMVQKETTSLHCSGGILADDQGLGKTISTIALMLTERSPSPNSSSVIVKQAKFEALNLDDDDDEVSEPDVTKQPADSGPLKIGCSRREGSSFASVKGRPAAGTLIVCPTSVLRQWADELKSKVTSKANLSFLVYHGGNRTKDPEELAKYDVVLTTYAIVSMEVPKQPLVDKDDEEKGKADSPDAFTSRKRKDPTSSNKKKNMKDQAETFARPLARVVWFRVVLDEAQSIKNYRTQTARACWGLRAKRRWCLSGTPIQNAIDDLYSYFRFLRYDPYAIYKSFCAMIKSPINRNPTTGYKKLQAVLKTIMLRRTKGTLLDGEPIINLPPKSISLKKVDFSSLERSFYSRLEADSRAQFKEYADAGTVKQNYVNILLMLLRLRQACDHPLLVKGYDSSASWKSSVETAKKLPREKRVDLLNCLEACLAICAKCNDPPEDAVVTTCGHVFCNQCICEHLTGDEKLCPAANCKVHLSVSSVFSKITLRTSLVDQDGYDCPPHDSSPEPAPELSMENLSDSTKIKAALEILQALPKSQDANSKCCSKKTSEDSCGPENAHGAGAHACLEDTHDEKQLLIGEKAIVFSQWTRMLDLLEIPLKNSSIQYRRLDGTMSVLARDKAVKDFNTIPEVTVMIMSLKAASLGLNMVAACHVLLLDLWWNPTTEDQAIDRAHRIGQTRPVTVSRLTIKDTVEDRILALQEKKRVMVASAFGEDETGGRQSRLTVEDLKYLFMV